MGLAIIVLLVVFCVLSNKVAGQGTACVAGTDLFGVNSPSSQSNNIDAQTNVGILMLGSKTAYISDCCGVVSKWHAVFNLGGLASADIYFQVWRPSGTSYTLVGENVFTITANGEDILTVSAGNRISIAANDRFGWYGAQNIIEHKNNNGADNYHLSMGKPAVGATVDWSGATVDAAKSYAIRIDTDGGNSPTFDGPVITSYTITNDQPLNTLITTLVYSDLDNGDVLTLTPTEFGDGSTFSLDTTTGQIKVSSSNLGPGTLSQTFRVTDYCSNFVETTITITVTNQAPVIHGMPQSVQISEDQTNQQLLYTLSVTDTADDFTCDFNPALDPTWPFTMILLPGTSDYGISVETNPNFNYDTKNSYALTVDCTDDWGATSTVETFNVYLIKNQAPVVHNLQASTIVSTTTTIGTTVFTVSATDAENDQIYMSMNCDPSPCPFEIFDSGAVQLNADISGYTTTGYDVNVTVWDAKNTVGPKILTLIIKDINDPVLINNLPLASNLPVSENQPLAASVFQVSFADQDTAQTKTFTMSSSPGAGLSYFSIDSATGLISTSATNLINYEALVAAGATSFNFVVTVNDGTSTDIQPLTIDVINVNEAPSFTQQTYSLSTTEGAANTVVGTPAFGTTDPDAGDTKAYNMDCGADTGRFSMDSSSGQVSFQSNYDTDAGMPTTVTCSVNVTDSGGLYDTATLYIYISDANDNTPYFAPTSYFDHISYYASVGTSVVTVTALDADTGTFGTLTYSLDQSSLLDQYFAIDNTGRIFVAKSPNGNAIGYATTVTITAFVTDGGGLSASAPVTITIGDTTTTSTTTTTDRYRTFIEDSKNIAWLVAAVVLLAVLLAVLAWLMYSCRGAMGWSAFTRAFCKKRKLYYPKRYQPRRMRTPPTPPSPPRPPPQSINVDTVRNPPPPKAHQQWRTEIDAPPDPKPIQGSGQKYEFWKHTDFTDQRLTKLI